MSLDALPPLRQVLAEAGIQPSRTLGQNFLLDLNLTRKIARAAGDLRGRTVIEIGPGPGGLTRALLERNPARLIAIERDRRCVAGLSPLVEAAEGRLEVIEADALALDVHTMGEAPRVIVANLPYNIATPLLIGWLAAGTAFESMTLMFQREVAERLVALPRTKAYGRLSVLAQWLAPPQLLLDIPASAFMPPPKVTSSVVHLRPRQPEPADPPRAVVERVTAAAFNQRRKMLRQALKALVQDPEQLCVLAGIDPTRRAEELAVSQFLALASVLACSAAQAGD